MYSTREALAQDKRIDNFLSSCMFSEAKQALRNHHGYHHLSNDDRKAYEDKIEIAFRQKEIEHLNFIEAHISYGNLAGARSCLDFLERHGMFVSKIKEKINAAERLQIAHKTTHPELQKLLKHEYKHNDSKILKLISTARDDLGLAKKFDLSSYQLTEYETLLKAANTIVATEFHISKAKKNHSESHLNKAKTCFDELNQYDIHPESIEALQKRLEAAAALFVGSEAKNNGECFQKVEKLLSLIQKLLAQEYHDVTEICNHISKARRSLYLAETFDVQSKKFSEYENQLQVLEMIVGTEKNTALAQQYHSEWYLDEAKKIIGFAKQHNIPQETIEKLQNKIDATAVLFQTESKEPSNTKITAEASVQTLKQNDEKFIKLTAETGVQTNECHEENNLFKQSGSPKQIDQVNLGVLFDLGKSATDMECANKCSSLAQKALREGHVEIAVIIAILAEKLYPEADFSGIQAEIFASTSQKPWSSIIKVVAPNANHEIEGNTHLIVSSVENNDPEENMATDVEKKIVDDNDTCGSLRIKENPAKTIENEDFDKTISLKVSQKTKDEIEINGTDDGATGNRVSDNNLNGNKGETKVTVERCLEMIKESLEQKHSLVAQRQTFNSDQMNSCEGDKLMLEKGIESEEGNFTEEGNTHLTKGKDGKDFEKADNLDFKSEEEAKVLLAESTDAIAQAQESEIQKENIPNNYSDKNKSKRIDDNIEGKSPVAEDIAAQVLKCIEDQDFVSAEALLTSAAATGGCILREAIQSLVTQVKNTKHEKRTAILLKDMGVEAYEQYADYEAETYLSLSYKLHLDHSTIELLKDVHRAMSMNSSRGGC